MLRRGRSAGLAVSQAHGDTCAPVIKVVSRRAARHFFVVYIGVCVHFRLRGRIGDGESVGRRESCFKFPDLNISIHD